jgi:hypothetical protein
MDKRTNQLLAMIPQRFCQVLRLALIWADAVAAMAWAYASTVIQIYKCMIAQQ